MLPSISYTYFACLKRVKPLQPTFGILVAAVVMVLQIGETTSAYVWKRRLSGVVNN